MNESKNVDRTSSTTEPDEAVQILEAVEEVNPSLFNGITKTKKTQIIRAFATVQRSHSGPLPDPETLSHYNEIIENGAERIMVMAEKEQSFRHEHTTSLTQRHLNLVSRGQVFGFILAFIAISGGIYLAYLGKDTAGIAVIITAVVALVGAFIFSKIKESKSGS